MLGVCPAVGLMPLGFSLSLHIPSTVVITPRKQGCSHARDAETEELRAQQALHRQPALAGPASLLSSPYLIPSAQLPGTQKTFLSSLGLRSDLGEEAER